jgi:hypothetical protein
MKELSIYRISNKKEERSLLMIHLSEENERICFVDDIEKVFRG